MPGVNKIVRSVNPNSLFESAKAVIDTTAESTWNQGDLLVFDATAHVLKVAAAEADGSTFLGIARVSIVAGKIVSPYNTDVVASAAINDIPGPQFGVVAKLVLKTGDSLTAGAQVYLDPATGTRGVTSTGTKAIGIYQGPAIATATAGVEVEVLLGCRYPNDALKF